MDHACSCGHHGDVRDVLPKYLEISKPGRTATRVDATETVAQVLQRSPAASTVLSRFGIDQCCGGRLTLREAAASAGIAVDDIVAALEAALTPAA